jgi:hypothetical protein
VIAARKINIPTRRNFVCMRTGNHPVLHSKTYNLQYLHDYFAREQVFFRNICVYEDHAGVPEDTSIITSKDLNWLGLPKPGPVDDFIKMEFDVLFNIALEQNRVLDYITALSHAKFKIGWSSQKSSFFDLNINISGKQDALYLAQQQIYYLAQLNKTA